MAALATRIASLLFVATLVFSVAAPAASASAYEDEALALLNSARAAEGLAPVSMHSDLVDDALAWTLHMKADGQLSHNPSLASVTDDWEKLGENVGLGTSIQALHAAFMKSTGHRGNILGDYDSVGIAVVAETESRLWITVVFMKSLNPPPATEEDPEPYAEEQPLVSNGEPVAAPQTDPAPKTVASPAAPAKPVVTRIVSVQVGGPIPD